ncbi:restriction endonuclease subunit S [Anabaena sp. FACHB-709]|uniref:Type I restriction-modification enzyme S subunit n=2 Tax=Nostocaceae TaxID=1162 RepID=A0A1Z4KH52_ANAVA|nr:MULTISPECIES: restriction endonuclease subunit S [Nostocaceae]BAY68308.1 type I restriction-modification enzyme S subunit [Trichormus variabilis NIES-23]HBW33477.1 restriction endonuclease subunit S [Nostoc sp. UBA8866]MBD2175244.1 restriction endonuclease subunit S [Anabaena cylindrica FACHB-318]MBD2267139.1 restriction endonuclease subunit S [Anabaena sp. FACHB-709]MBD2276691.1 restriction endonuclease subunit S [Nostoc sp. PCC 7120 = FACHB-418]
MKTNFPESYQKTEFGIVPNDWKIRKLVECCNKITDGTHDTPKPLAQGIPFLTAIHVKEGFIDFNNCYYLPQSIHESIYKRCNPEKNDVLMVNIGAGVATTALIDVEYEFSLKNVALLKPDKNNLIGSYLNYCLSLNKFRITNQLLSGGAQPFLSLKQIGEISIPIPPTIEEQEAIAQSLSDVDALITECDRIIAKKHNTKQGTMQQLLTGEKRLPGFSGEWEVEEFEQVLKVVDGDRGDNYPSNDELFDNGYCLFLSAKNVTKGGFKFSDCTFITKEKDNLLGNGKLCKKDVVLTTRGTVGNIAFFDYSVPFENIRINSGMVILRSEDKNLDNSYLYSFLKSHLFQTQIDRAVFGSAQPQLTVKGISKFKIPVSSLPEQKAIAQILSDMDTEIAALEQKRDKYKAIKQGMMQELLTGKTRLICSS